MKMRWSLVSLLGLVTLAALGAPRAAADPFWGEHEITLGDGVTSSFSIEGERHDFPFFAVAGTRIDAVVRRGAGSSVTPGLRLLRPGGYEVPTRGALHARGARADLRRFTLPYSGWFVLEASARSGIGAYELTTSAREARGLRGYVAHASGDQEYQFWAAEGTTLGVVVSARSRRSGARPHVVGIQDPDGVLIPVTADDRGRNSRIHDVPLPMTGRYVLVWRNDGRTGDVGIRFTFRNPDVATTDRILPAASGIPASRVERGDPRIDPAEGYVGSGACGRCHDQLFRDFTQTAHHLAVRPWDQQGLAGTAFVNDANGNGADDFRDGLDLATEPAFAAYGANAPKLLYVTGALRPYRMQIGPVTYDVVRTMGGNGLWRQGYLLQAGNHMYPSPVEYDEARRTYTAFQPGDWYDTGNAPLYPVATAVPKSRSFEARCSGCHNTGETIQVDPQSGDYLTGCVDFNVGCEQCHGPGAKHAETGDRTKISNPRRLLDGTQAGLEAANAVCGRCHTRGEAVDAFPGTAVKAGFGFSAAKGVARVGDTLALYLAQTTDPADFWGYKTNPFPALPGDTWVASKSSQQQAIDFAVSGHRPDVEADEPACFDCHDPHSRRNEHQIVAAVVRSDLGVGKSRAAASGIRIATDADDDSLCLSCHAGEEPFAGLTLAAVAQISSGSPPAEVARAVVGHMADRGMWVDVSKYDPAGTGVGNCVTCHMPLVQSSNGTFGADAAGNRKGDLHAHVFHTVTARATQLHKDGGVGMSNSCNACHPTAAGDPVAQILTDWATDDGDGTFHGDTPRNFQNGLANPGRDGGTPCARCHTTEGFVDIQVKGETLTQARIDGIVKDAIRREKGIACDACHGTRGDGSLVVTDRQPLRMPKAQLCGSCHNNQTVVFEDFRDAGEMVRHPMREMLLGTAGSEAPGYGTWSNTAHSSTPGLFEDGCVTCHFDPTLAGASHRFEPQVATCGNCHSGLATFNRPATSDWDGDGNTSEGIQGEVQGLLDRVKAALLTDVQVTFTASSYFEYGGAADHKMTGASEAQKRAAFNWYSVQFDGSRGVHNAARAIQLLQRSYREVTGSDVPGAVLR